MDDHESATDELAHLTATRWAALLHVTAALPIPIQMAPIEDVEYGQALDLAQARDSAIRTIDLVLEQPVSPIVQKHLRTSLVHWLSAVDLTMSFAHHPEEWSYVGARLNFEYCTIGVRLAADLLDE